jgi:alpha-L-fucosidase 2
MMPCHVGFVTILAGLCMCAAPAAPAQPQAHHDLRTDRLAPVWDEAAPLGNGMLGALVWQKNGKVRLSLDRADLWDLRPMKGLDRPEFRWDWVRGQVAKNEYAIVQEYFDAPYEREPAPTKIPGAALEFDTTGLGAVTSVELSLKRASVRVTWAAGTTLTAFVHATLPVGWFTFTNAPATLHPVIVPPAYAGTADTGPAGSVEGDNLVRLGYSQGKVDARKGSSVYTQAGWGGFSYQVATLWRASGKSGLEGTWSISSKRSLGEKGIDAREACRRSLARGAATDLRSHTQWWNTFWLKSALHVPDPLLEKQWYQEQYRFGSTSRRGAPPISLQAIWTADNGRIPPWKGDFHHDLNTQLSYWPSYSGNHLDEGLAYLDHLDGNLAAYKTYTKRYFQADGLNVPGVTTLDGTEMAGWIQYSCGPTVSAWLAQHYWLQWRYSMDTVFLRTRAYPWLRETAAFLECISTRTATGARQLPLSSSPEIHNNDISAWFTATTNYDLSLMRFAFGAAADAATVLGKHAEAAHWTALKNELPAFALEKSGALMFAPTLPYRESHRHFSHAMAIHPLGLIRWEDGTNAQRTIRATLALLDSVGPKYWCGYSYAWLGNMKARAKDGDGAAHALGIFARAFCTSNGFHVNGDQTKSGLSSFTYRPFTLEGNFAFAAGLQEMLLQSYAGAIELFPAVPAAWQDVSFRTLRAEGAFLVSAAREGGQVAEVTITAERGGTARLKKPFRTWFIASQHGVKVTAERDAFVITCQPGGTVTLKNGYE